MSQVKIALPDGKRGWTLWSGRKRVGEDRELDELIGQGNDVCIGVPATLSTTFAVKIPTTEQSLFPAMVQAQVEKRGLAHQGDGAGTPHSFYVIETEGNETLLSVDVLSEDFPEALCLSRASDYSPSGRLLRLPDDQLFLWIEHKRLVLAVNRRGKLSHIQVLSAEPLLSTAAAQEINLTTLSLQAEGLVEEAPELLVAGELAEASPDDRAEFEKALLMPTEFTSEPVAPSPSLPELTEGFLPTAVVGARRRRGSARKRTVAGLFAAAVYLVIGTFLWLYAQKTEARINQLETRVDETRPEVEAIQEAEARWRQLEQGFDLHYYPLVQLNEITRAMPGSGVVIREFETRGRNIKISGRARDVQLAFRLKEDLEANPFFRAYAWDIPQPRVERDHTVTFQIQGTPKNEGTDN